MACESMGCPNAKYQMHNCVVSTMFLFFFGFYLWLDKIDWLDIALWAAVIAAKTAAAAASKMKKEKSERRGELWTRRIAIDRFRWRLYIVHKYIWTRPSNNKFKRIIEKFERWVASTMRDLWPMLADSLPIILSYYYINFVSERMWIMFIGYNDTDMYMYIYISVLVQPIVAPWSEHVYKSATWRLYLMC